MGVCNFSMFCLLLYVHSSIVIILKRELIALLNLSSCCLMMVERLFLAVPRGCLQFVIVVFPDHTHLLLLKLEPNRAKLLCCETYTPKNCESLIRHLSRHRQRTAVVQIFFFSYSCHFMNSGFWRKAARENCCIFH